MREARQALLLIALEHVDPGGGAGPENADRHDHDETSEHREMAPRHSGHEEHRAERREVNECRAEVGLGEDEHDRQEAEPDDPQGRLPGAHDPLALGQQPGQRQHEEKLPELRRLEREAGRTPGQLGWPGLPSRRYMHGESNDRISPER